MFKTFIIEEYIQLNHVKKIEIKKLFYLPNTLSKKSRKKGACGSLKKLLCANLKVNIISFVDHGNFF